MMPFLTMVSGGRTTFCDHVLYRYCICVPQPLLHVRTAVHLCFHCNTSSMSTSSGFSYSRLQSASNGIHLSLTGSLNHLIHLPQFLHRVISIFYHFRHIKCEIK